MSLYGNRADQLRAAARQYDNASPDEDDDLLESTIEAIRADDARMADIHETVSEALDGPQYVEIVRLLDGLHGMDSERLIGSQLLTDFYRLARNVHPLVEAQVLSEAATESDAIRDGRVYDEGERLAWSHEDAA